MRKILLLTLLTIFGGASSVKAETSNLQFKTESYCAASWDSSNNIFSWGLGGWNSAWTFMIVKDLSGDLSSWETLHLKLTEFTNSVSPTLTIYFKENKGNTQSMDWVTSAELTPDANGIVELDLTTFDWENDDPSKGTIDKTNIVDVTIYGGTRTDNAENGSVKVTEAYLYKADPEYVVTYVVKDTNGTTIFESSPQATTSGTNITTLPNEFKRGFCTYNDVDVTIEDPETTIEFTATWNGPIPIYANYASISEWKNLYLDRSKKWYLNNGASPCLVGDPRDFQRMDDSYQWALVGNPYSYRIYNKATGNSKTLNGSAAMADGEYIWTKVADNDGGILFGKSDGNFLNQAGGDGNTTLGFWHIVTDPGSTFFVATIPTDALYTEKSALLAAINKGNAQNSFAKTAASFAVLTSAISDAETELDNASATAESLTAAITPINSAIAGFVLENGYTNLTEDMYNTWNDNYIPTNPSAVGCNYNLNVSTGQPYGDGNVQYLNFADISDFSKLIILGTDGAPRIMMNRLEVGNGGGDANGGSYVQIADNFVEGKKEVDLTEYDYAHLNAIKGANYSSVTVSDMLLYRTVTIGSTGKGTFGSLTKNAKLNDVTVYAATYNDGTGKVTLTEVPSGIVPAGKGVIIEAAEGSYEPTFDVDASDITSDLLVSNGTVTGDGSTIFALANGKNGVGFYLVKSGKTVPAGKAYLVIPVLSTREFIGFDGETTGIKTIDNAQVADKYYDLQGRRVAQPTKGLYIVNGKKVVK